MKNIKKEEVKQKVRKSMKESVLQKKGSLTINTKVTKTDSKKSLISTKANNTRQISIQLFSSKLKNSSKSTPIMNFKSTGDGTRHKNSAVSKEEKEEIVFPEETNKVAEKIATGKSLSKVKIMKKSNMFRKSITSKDDIYSSNKTAVTPESKKGTNLGSKKSIFDIKPKSSNFPSITIKTDALQLQHQLFHTPTSSAQTNSKYSLQNCNSNQNLNQFNSNYILTTNYSENNNQNKDTKDEDFILTPQLTPTNKQDPSPVQPDIISTIQALGKMLKPQEDLSSNPEEIKHLDQMLNNKLQIQVKNQVSNNTSDSDPHSNNSHLNFHLNDSRNLLMENNVIRRETFIDNNFNKKSKINEEMNDILNNSNNRMKKYGILFDFINNNIKEITELVSQNTSTNKEESSNACVAFNKEIGKVLTEEKYLNPEISHSFINSSASDIDFYRNLIDQTFNQKVDNISNEMSTLHSKIDFSVFNDKLDKTQYQYEDIRSKLATPNCLDVNETKYISENPKGDDKKNMINPRLLLQQLKEKKLDKKRQTIQNDKPSNQIEQDKCIIF